LSANTSLVIELAQIPPEGLAVDTDLDAGALHLEADGAFELNAGAHLVCRIERGEGDSVHVKGRFTAEAGLGCSRCLERSLFPVGQALDVFYLPRIVDRTVDAEEEDDVELSDHDLVVAYYEGGRFDLGELVREQIVLSLPMKPLCVEGCRGLCLQCGANRNQHDCGCKPLADPRLSGLADLLGPGSK
jgi:uncharacterized protein